MKGRWCGRVAHADHGVEVAGGGGGSALSAPPGFGPPTVVTQGSTQQDTHPSPAWYTYD